VPIVIFFFGIPSFCPFRLPHLFPPPVAPRATTLIHRTFSSELRKASFFSGPSLVLFLFTAASSRVLRVRDRGSNSTPDPLFCPFNRFNTGCSGLPLIYPPAIALNSLKLICSESHRLRLAFLRAFPHTFSPPLAPQLD